MRLLPSPVIFLNGNAYCLLNMVIWMRGVSSKEETRIPQVGTQSKRSGLQRPLRDESDCCVGWLFHLSSKLQIYWDMNILLSPWQPRCFKDTSRRKRLEGVHVQDMGWRPCGHIFKVYSVPGHPLKPYFVGMWKLGPPEVPSCFPRGFPAQVNKNNIEDNDVLGHWPTNQKHFNTRYFLQHPDGQDTDRLLPDHLTW